MSRAAPGTRERQLEKRREAAYSTRSYAQTAHDAGPLDLSDAQIMGGSGDGDAEDDLAHVKRQRAEHERKKSERESRREATLRAKKAEREERLRRMREREERTMAGLRKLARLRFGGGSSTDTMTETQ